MNRWTPIALSLLAVTLCGCVDRQAQQQAKATQKIVSDPTQVISVASVVPQPLSETLDITGEVTTGEDTNVGAKQSGRLLAVYVNDGDPVASGQIIAVQDSAVQQAQLRQALAALSNASAQLSQAISNAKVGPSKSAAGVAQAEAQLKSAQANLKKLRAGARKEERVQVEWQVRQAKTNMDTAQKDVERKQALFDQGAIPKSQLESAQNAYMAALSQYNAALQTQAIQTEGARDEDIAVAQESVRSAEEQVRQARAQQKLDVLYSDQVAAAQAGVQSARAQVDVARQSVADTQIKSPFSGRVAGKPAQAGQIVGPGNTVARVVGATGAYFEGDVPESEIRRIQSGSPVTIRLTALPGKAFGGRIVAVNPVGSQVGRLFTVRVSFTAISPDVKPGMFAQGTITLSTISNAIVVPSTAVVPYRDEQVVFVLNGKDAVKPLPVKTGLRQGDQVQIVSGLAPGEKVVVRGQENLTEKSKVRVEEKKAAMEGSGKADHA